MEAPALYMVKFWVKPGGEKKVFDWLDGGHLQDVVKQPGFLWARRYKLVEPDKDGWAAHAMLYGVKSLDALYAYFKSEPTKRYAQERIELGLDPLLKMDRNWGTLELAVAAPAAGA
ncbi:MAG: hypothetical protein KIT16_00975 [Rhodospirillaceae bacterium]|nr:hypothetical protein [Rhodospirillaceae bacterium]